jgi:hypothetical protein
MPGLTTPMKTATFLIRLSPDERDRLNAMAREQRISLAQAMREGAKLYLRELQERGASGEVVT